MALHLTDDEKLAVADALSYYRMCDDGHGDERPLDHEQEEHKRLIASAVAKFDRELSGA